MSDVLPPTPPPPGWSTSPPGPLDPGGEDPAVLMEAVLIEAAQIDAERTERTEQPGSSASQGMKTAATAGVVRAGAMMAVATMVSRVTGFLSKAVILAFLGSWVVSDSYNLANTLPNIVFELLIGGVLTSVAIPLLSRARADPDGGDGYTHRLMTLALVGLLAATGLAMAAAPLLTRLYLSGGNTTDPVMATQLAYLLLPQIFFYGMAALFGAVLNTKEHFAAPAWAPVVNNLIVIGVGAALFVMPQGGVVAHDGMAELSRSQFLLLGLGTTAGIVMQAVVMLPALRRSGYRFRWRWGWDSRMAEAGRLMGWAIIYVLISQAAYVVTAQVASGSRAGLYTLYNYGSMLFQLPYGILGVSLLTAIMPRMSRHAAAGEMGAVKHDMSLANRLSAVALLPVSAAMVALAGALAAITAHGKVDAANVSILGTALAAFAVGLLPLAMTLVQMRVFYAMKDGRTPTLINLVMVAVRIPLLLACQGLDPRWVVPGLAASVTISYLVGAVVGELWLRHRFGAVGSRSVLVTIGKMTIASALGGLAAFAVVQRLFHFRLDSIGQVLLQLLVGGLVGLLVVAAVAALLRVHELDGLRQRIGRLLRRFSGRNRPGSGHDGPGRGTLVGSATAGSAGAAAAVAAGHPEPRRTGSPVNAPNVQEQPSVTDHDTPEGPSLGGSPPTPGWAPGAANAPRGTPIGPPGGTHAARPAETTGATAPVVGGPGAAGAPEPARVSGHRSPAHDTPAAFAPGVVVGERYRLVSLVATDSAGNRFWRARDTVLPRDMAVTLLADGPATSATVNRTLRAGRLHHIGLPQTLDVGTVDGQTYVVGQWVEGATLTDLLTGGPLEPGVATSIIAKLSDAVGAAHRGGIALGAVHPSLVRVNFDGQVRLSHVIAHGNAQPDQDIRAIGGLLYLMLTGTWPLPAADGAPSLPAAPTRLGRERPAAEVNPQIPAALSALADRTLHPDEPQGIHAVGAITALLRAPDSAPSRAGIAVPQQHRRASQEPARALSPAEQKLVKERWAKLLIATVMLAAFAALIIIVVAAVSKQALTAMAETPDQGVQRLDVTSSAATLSTAPTTPITALSLPPATAATAPSGPVAPSTAASAPPAAPAAGPVKIVDGAVYDPQGKPPKDYESYVDRAYDGNPDSDWMTWVYKQQFGKATGGLKDGVGLVLTLEKSTTPTAVTVSVSQDSAGTVVEIRSAATPNPALADTTVLGSATITTAPAAIQLSNAPASQYLIVWVTHLAPYKGQFQSGLTEISVTGN